MKKSNTTDGSWENENKAPWNFSLMPNYERALPVAIVAAEQITEKEFYRDYVAKNRPCLITGAATHWPAFSNWRSIAYLKDATKNDLIRARSEPDPEFSRQLSKREEMPFHDFLERASTHPEQLVVHSINLGSGLRLEGLLKDIGSYKFLSKPGKPRAYVSLRAFFYRNSYTDWHPHPSDETLMTQVLGDKEVLLLPPDDHSWNALMPVAKKKTYLYDIDLNEFPEVANLWPYRAVVRAGDALYIPVFWWHAVASADDKFGITIAKAFATPLHIAGDMRYPLARQVFKDVLKSPLLPLALVAVSYSYVYRIISMCSRWAFSESSNSGK